MKVVGYIRVSTQEQADDGMSLVTQRAAIEERCRERGWELVNVIEDRGHSGRKDDRPGLNKVLAMVAKRNGPKAIVVFRLDRLSRSMKYLAAMFDLSAKQRWGIVALDRDIDTTNASGLIVAHVMAAVAQYESGIIGERVAVGMRNAYSEARARGEQPAFGFQRQTPDIVVTRIVRARKRGDSFNQIAQRLDRSKTPTPGGGVKWQSSTVRRIYNAATAERSAS